MRYLFFSVWVPSLSIVILRFICVAANGIIISFYGRVIFHFRDVCVCVCVCVCVYVCVYRIFFIHSSVDGHLGCFNVLAIVNSSAVNIGVHVPFWIMVFSRYMPRTEIVESYGNFIFSFYSNLYRVFYSGCT